MEEKIRVVYVEPGKWAKITEVGTGLKSMQEVEGGPIQAVPYFDDPVTLVSNENGMIKRLPANRAIYDDQTGELFTVIAGPFFICYADPEKESFESLPMELAEKYKEKFLYPQIFLNTVDGLIII